MSGDIAKLEHRDQDAVTLVQRAVKPNASQSL